MNNIKILIVEDMALTALTIKNTLLRLGYSVVDTVDTYNDALKSVQKHKPDALIIDIGLKGKKTGIDLANTINKNYDIPLLYLTADTHEETLEKITDNYPYLLKPFRANDLKANLHKILHTRKMNNNLLPMGNHYMYDVLTNDIYYKKDPVLLSPNEKLFLNVLILGKNNIIPFHVAEAHIWCDNPPLSDNALRNLLSSLRSKLKFMTIETIPSIGYKLISETR
jgi:DNA-binding response OmpR family regulator